MHPVRRTGAALLCGLLCLASVPAEARTLYSSSKSRWSVVRASPAALTVAPSLPALPADAAARRRAPPPLPALGASAIPAGAQDGASPRAAPAAAKAIDALKAGEASVSRAVSNGPAAQRALLNGVYDKERADAPVDAAAGAPAAGSPATAALKTFADKSIALWRMARAGALAAADASGALPLSLPGDDVLAQRMRISPARNPDREKALIAILMEAGARRDRVITVAQGQAPPLDIYDTVILQDAGEGRHNIMVVKRGRSDRLQVLSSHHDKVFEGLGTIDNWSGSTANAATYQALRGVATESTLVFLLTAREEEGLVGARYWLRSLTPQQRARIDSDVNVDTIGVDGTFSWSNNSDRVMLDRAMEAATGAGLQLIEARLSGGDADSSVFRRARPPIPALTIFGASQEAIWDIIHSSRDTMDAFVFSHYKNTVLVLIELMKLLDRKPARSATGVSI